MEQFAAVVSSVRNFVWEFGIPVGDGSVPFVVIALIGTGFFLTFRLGFVQIRHFGHGVAVATGRYDDPNDAGDVTHFQALTTALSATVGIGNIAGVAIAIHWGGPGALFWMWLTAAVGMATKYTEVTLAQKYRVVHEGAADAIGSVSGGPMYYIEKGLGPNWRWMGMFFALMLGITAFLTGNAIQANTVADTLSTQFGTPNWVTGLVTVSIIAAVVLGGIGRIGKVTGVLAPAMAALYVFGAGIILMLNVGEIFPSLATIFTEAFNPSAGVAGTGIGALLVTLTWGANRGLFSNEAGQGSAPIAHAAARTQEPVSEGVVALLEPFIDTIVIVTMTALVIIITGVSTQRIPTEIVFAGGDLTWVQPTSQAGYEGATTPAELSVSNGAQAAVGGVSLGWHDVPVDDLFVDEAMTQRFTGTIYSERGEAVDASGTVYTSLWGNAAESGAPLTMYAFRVGLPGDWGHYIVIISVFLFGISTAISWSYYGDRCANYLFGESAIIPYKFVYLAAHFAGAMISLNLAWEIGDIALGIVILPNLIALVLLSGKVKQMTDDYFQRRPWENIGGSSGD
jgi:AGCS family alanine or glycine:cation symporter